MYQKNQISLLPTKIPSVFNVQLNLEHQRRFIGKLDTAGQGTFLTNRKPQHLFRKTNSLGVNYHLLTDELISFRWIVVSYEGKKLQTSRLYFLSKGKYFQFGSKGFEAQMFLTLSEFGLDKAETFERLLTVQEEFQFSEVV